MSQSRPKSGFAPPASAELSAGAAGDHAVSEEAGRAQRVISGIFTTRQLSAMAFAALAILLLICIFVIARPLYQQDQHVHFTVNLLLSLCLSIFFFVFWPQQLELSEIPLIRLPVRVTGPVVLWIGVLLLLLKVTPQTGEHWEHLKPEAADGSIPGYQTMITMERIGGGELDYRILKDPGNPDWAVFVKFIGLEDKIVAKLHIPHFNPVPVELVRNERTFKPKERLTWQDPP